MGANPNDRNDQREIGYRVEGVDDNPTELRPSLEEQSQRPVIFNNSSDI